MKNLYEPAVPDDQLVLEKILQKSSRDCTLTVSDDGIVCRTPMHSRELKLGWDQVRDFYISSRITGDLLLLFTDREDGCPHTIPVRVTPGWFPENRAPEQLRHTSDGYQQLDGEFNDWVTLKLEDNPLHEAILKGLEPLLANDGAIEQCTEKDWELRPDEEVLVNRLKYPLQVRELRWQVLLLALVLTLLASWHVAQTRAGIDFDKNFITLERPGNPGSRYLIDPNQLYVNRTWWAPLLLLPWLFIRGGWRLSADDLEVLRTLPPRLSLSKRGIGFIAASGAAPPCSILLPWKDIQRPVKRIGSYLMLELKETSVLSRTLGLPRLRIYPTYHPPGQKDAPGYRLRVKNLLIEVKNEGKPGWRPVKEDDSPIIERILSYLDSV